MVYDVCGEWVGVGVGGDGHSFNGVVLRGLWGVCGCGSFGDRVSGCGCVNLGVNSLGLFGTSHGLDIDRGRSVDVGLVWHN